MWARRFAFEMARQDESDTTVWFSKTENLDFGSIGAGATAELTITIDGVQASDSVNVTPPTGLEAGLVVCGIPVLDGVKVRLGNITGAAIDPAAGDYSVDVWRTQ